ncbi:hypothetical protein LOC68_17020 [Blastopirellula sp. JC732]|uniref:EF-hand domain-containing protein n=1 Tax=Blastopirellula sediminis TaxID=2894196 RepID=A0A9X1MQD7_9BACT|nr:ELWxxDGT repeat protein [Blastopirellula sediminis]MCC9606606.1 hypothetical protein [Blastopirellula sediminis]MCC9630097.1 hypothetical protein [Blastopirellula sediminis]
MSKNPVRSDRAHARPSRRPYILQAEQLEVRDLLAADLLPQADLLEGEPTPTIAADASALVYAVGSTATNSGTFANAVNLSASVGAVVDNGDGTWTWTLGDVQVGDTQTVTITADDGAGASVETTFELTVESVEFQLLKDTEPGNVFNYISPIVWIGEVGYFTTYPSSFPVTLWKTDGTPDGTTIIESTFTGIVELVDFNDELYFLRRRNYFDDQSYDLWKYDETTDQAILIYDFTTNLRPGSAVASAVAGNLLYFNVDDGIHGQELWVSDGTTEGTHLVADIIPGSTGTEIRDLTATDDLLFFVANDGIHGNELWRTDGTAEGTLMVTDLYSSESTQRPYFPTAVGNVVYFLGPDDTIWKANGTVGETTQLYVNTPAGALPIADAGGLRVVDGQFYFSFANQLWTSDGTLSGTQPITSAIGVFGSQLVAQARIGDDLYFIKDSYYGPVSDELWKLDESTGEEILLASFPPTTIESYPLPLLVVEGAVYFRGYDDTYGFQRWRTDGTPEGTTRITSFVTQSGTIEGLPSAGPNGTLFFKGETEQVGRESFFVQLDTPPVIRLQPIQISADVQNVILSALGTFDFLDALSELQFDWDLNGDGNYDDASGLNASISIADLATIGMANISLRVIDTDGNIATRSFVIDPNVPLISVNDDDGISVNEGEVAVYSGRLVHILGNEIQLSASIGEVVDNGDGTWTWRYQTEDGPDDSQAVTITASSDEHSASVSFQLRVNNVGPVPTVAETSVTVSHGMLAVNSGTYSDVPADVVHGTASVGEIIVRDDGTWTWSYDTSQAPLGSKTVVIYVYDELGAFFGAAFHLKVEPAPPALEVDATSVNFVTGSTASNSGALLNQDGVPVTLSASVGTVVDNGDGTWFWSLGDVQVADAQTVTITASDGDGVVSTTEFSLAVVPQPQVDLIADLISSYSSNPAGFIRLGAYIYFNAPSDDFGFGLWRTDGTLQGTALIKETGPLFTVILNVEGTLFFSTYQNSIGTLWTSDGTTDGTVPIVSLPSRIQSLTELNGAVFFNASDGLLGEELWRSDGTSVGTAMVADINPLGASIPMNLVASNGALFFTATDGVHDYQLWKSDGTPTGTIPLTDLPERPRSLSEVNGVLYFAASDGTNGRELWRSDGTVEGTFLVANIAPGEASSDPYAIVAIDGALYFQATTAEHGDQLWKFDPATGLAVRLTDITLTERARIEPKAGFQGDVYFTVSYADALYYRTDQPWELWKTNGEPDGASKVLRLAETTSSTIFDLLVDVSGKAYFRGFDRDHGFQLWLTDGTAEGTVRVTDVPGGPNFTWITQLGDQLIFRTETGDANYEPHRLEFTAGPVARIADPRQSPDGQSLLLSAYGSFDFQDPVSDLQFAWDLDGDGMYDDAVGMNVMLPLSELELPDDWAISVQVTNTRNVIATASRNIDTQTPYVTVDLVERTIDLSETAVNGGEFGDLKGETVSLSASLGEIIDNGDGTWRWSYAAPATGPSTNHEVVITASDGLHQRQVSFILEVTNPPPVVQMENAKFFAKIGDTVTTSGFYSDTSADVVSLTASLGELIDHGDGTWDWSYTILEGARRDIASRITAIDSDGARGVYSISIQTIPSAEAYLTINGSSPETNQFGEVDALPADLEIVTEWDSFTVNVWVRRDEPRIDQLTNVSMNLHFNNEQFRLEDFSPSRGVASLDVNTSGDIIAIDASGFDNSDFELGELLHIGSFRFKPDTNSQIANNISGDYPQPIALSFSLTDVEITTNWFGVVPGQQVGAPTTQLQVVPYDVDDDGVIGLTDLTYLIGKIGDPVADVPGAYKYDFDRDGYVSLVDLIYLIRNIGASQANGTPIQLPPTSPPANPLVETESLAIQTSASVLLEGEAIPLSLPSSDEHNVDAAFGNLSLLEECWEFPSDGAEEEELVEAAASFSTGSWQPEQLPDWALQASSIVECFAEKAIDVLEELEEEHPRLERAARWLKNRLEDF